LVRENVLERKVGSKILRKFKVRKLSKLSRGPLAAREEEDIQALRGSGGTE
jgi:hypothetical protein